MMDRKAAHEAERNSKHSAQPEMKAAAAEEKKTGSEEACAADRKRGEEESEEQAKQAETEQKEEKETAQAETSDPSPEEEKKADPRDRKIEELTDRLKRNLAEFDNYRKRTEKEKTAMLDFGAKKVLEKLLPVIDNFERSLAAAPDLPEAKAYVDGMEMIYRQLLKNMEEVGAVPMESVGKQFDPAYHNAVMHVEDKALDENVIVEELQKGYLYKDGVLRHSMVKVAN